MDRPSSPSCSHTHVAISPQTTQSSWSFNTDCQKRSRRCHPGVHVSRLISLLMSSPFDCRRRHEHQCFCARSAASPCGTHRGLVWLGCDLSSRRDS
jgi:hypothetical protein